jgi:hypothetical protein
LTRDSERAALRPDIGSYALPASTHSFARNSLTVIPIARAVVSAKLSLGPRSIPMAASRAASKSAGGWPNTVGAGGSRPGARLRRSRQTRRRYRKRHHRCAVRPLRVHRSRIVHLAPGSQSDPCANGAATVTATRKVAGIRALCGVIGSSSAGNRAGAKRNLRACREASEASRSAIAALLLGGNTRGHRPTSGWPKIRAEHEHSVVG